MNNQADDSSDKLLKSKKLAPMIPFPPGTVCVWDGHEFQPLPPAEVAKLPVTAAAMAVVKRMRSRITRELEIRSELMIIASAMIEAAEHLPDVVERVREYGAQVYARRIPSK